MILSVCMATFNGEKYIKEQIESILNQINEEDELLISDDSSTDKTINIIENIKDRRIKLLKGNKFYNPCFNFENAISKATGDIIFLADQDDIWKKNKVEICLDQINKCHLLLHNVTIIDIQNNEIGDWFSYTKVKRGMINNLLKNSYLGCAMVFRKEILNKVLPFPKDTPMHDSWIGLICEKYFEINFVSEELIYHRRHDKNFSSAGSKSKRDFSRKIIDRLILIKNIYKK